MFDVVSVWLLSMVMRKKVVTYSMMTIGESRRENSMLLMRMMMMKFSLSSAEKIDYFHQLLTMNDMLDELIKK